MTEKSHIIKSLRSPFSSFKNILIKSNDRFCLKVHAKIICDITAALRDADVQVITASVVFVMRENAGKLSDCFLQYAF